MREHKKQNNTIVIAGEMSHNKEISMYINEIINSGSSLTDLIYLSKSYEDKLEEFRNKNDLSIQDNWITYKRIQERKKEIDITISELLMNESATITKSNIYFDSDSGHIYDNDTAEILGSADMSEDYEHIYIRDFEGNVIHSYGNEKDNEDGINGSKPRSRKEVYEGWNYTD
jgi:hypothetical protein